MSNFFILITSFLFFFGCKENNSQKKIYSNPNSPKIKEINIFLTESNMTGISNSENTSPYFYNLVGNKMYKLKAIDERRRDTIAQTILESDLNDNLSLPEKCFNTLNTYGLDNDGGVFEIVMTTETGKYCGFNVTELNDEIVPLEFKNLMKKIKKGTQELGALQN